MKINHFQNVCLTAGTLTLFKFQRKWESKTHFFFPLVLEQLKDVVYLLNGLGKTGKQKQGETLLGTLKFSLLLLKLFNHKM